MTLEEASGLLNWHEVQVQIAGIPITIHADPQKICQLATVCPQLISAKVVTITVAPHMGIPANGPAMRRDCPPTTPIDQRKLKIRDYITRHKCTAKELAARAQVAENVLYLWRLGRIPDRSAKAQRIEVELQS